MRIALCTVFRDEERNVVSMLHSCFKAVDGVIALNNGSQDRSETLIHHYCMKAGIPCAMMHEPEVCGYPDGIYNRVLGEAAAQGYDWILLLDADEQLSGFARGRLREWAEGGGSDAYELSRRTVITSYCPTSGGEIEPYTDSVEFNERHFRLFRAGSVTYPEGNGPHRAPAPVQGATIAALDLCPTCIFHDRDGYDQLRRDKLRGQYPETPLPTPSQCAGGWYDYEPIYRMAVEECRDGGMMVELGNYLGRSILDLGAKVQASGKKVRIVGCDLYRLNPSPYQHVEIMEDGCRWLPRLSESVIRAGLGDIVSLLQWPSSECAKLFEDESVDFCFVDADHDRPGVDNDLAAWWPKIRRGGLFAGHDWSTIFPGVMGAVTEFAEREGMELDVTTSLGSWLVRKP